MLGPRLLCAALRLAGATAAELLMGHLALAVVTGRDGRLDCAAQVDAWLAEPVGADALLAVQQPIVRALLPDAAPMPAAQELVTHCHNRGIPMALVTSSSRDAVEFKAAPHPWLEQIHERVYGDDPDLDAGKPDPAPFRLAAQRLGLHPKDCWALEDSQAGSQSALGARINKTAAIAAARWHQEKLTAYF